MKGSKVSISLTAAAALLLGGCGGGKSAAPAPIDAAAQQEEVSALLRDWAASGSERRFDNLKALYADTDGFAWIEQGRVAYADHGAIAAGVDMARDMGAQIRSEVSDIRVTPLAADAAAFVADASVSVRAENFGFDFSGVISGVAIRNDGRWRFLQGHMSAPAPGDERASPEDAPPL